jgi:hypothetical protein
MWKRNHKTYLNYYYSILSMLLNVIKYFKDYNYIACGFYQDFLDRVFLLTRKLLNQGFLVVQLQSYFESFTVAICVTNDYENVLFVLIIIQFFTHSWLITRFGTRVTGEVPHVEQVLITLLATESIPSFSGGRVALSLVFCVTFCRSLLVLSSFLFWFTAFDWPSGIFKLFFSSTGSKYWNKLF